MKHGLRISKTKRHNRRIMSALKCVPEKLSFEVKYTWFPTPSEFTDSPSLFFCEKSNQIYTHHHSICIHHSDLLMMIFCSTDLIIESCSFLLSRCFGDVQTVYKSHFLSSHKKMKHTVEIFQYETRTRIYCGIRHIAEVGPVISSHYL